MVTVDELLIQIKADIGDLSKKLDDADKSIGKFTDSTKKKNKDNEESWFNVQTAVSSAFGFTFASILSSAASSLQEFIKDSVVSAAKFEQSMQSLNMVTQGAANTILTNMRTATHGLVDDLTLVQASARAVSFGISQDLLPGLAETAIALSKIQGTKASDALNDIVLGIARGSPQILDNLGIILDTDKAYSEFAITLGKTADALTKMEKQRALTIEITRNEAAVVAASNAQEELAIDTYTRWEVSAKNLAKTIGQDLLNGLKEIMGTTDGVMLSQLRLDETYQAARNSVQTYSNLILAEDKQLKELSATAQQAALDLDSIFSGNSRTQEEINLQKELNRERLNEFQLVQSGGNQGGAVTESQNYQKDILNRLEEIRLKKQVMLDEEKTQEEYMGIRKREAVANNLADLQLIMNAKEKQYTDNKLQYEELKKLQDKDKENLDYVKGIEQERYDLIVKQNQELREQQKIIKGIGALRTSSSVSSRQQISLFDLMGN